MSAGIQDTLFPIDILTPPPSDLDDCDMTRLLTCSPALSQTCYPSPTPSFQNYSLSMSSTDQQHNYQYPEDDMSYGGHLDGGDAQNHHLFYQQVASAAQQSPYFQPTLPSHSIPLYDNPLDLQPTTSAESYQTFTQPSWSTSYAAYDTYAPQELMSNPFTTTNLIPPTPQTADQGTFDFSLNPFSQHPPFNHQLSQSSISSLSRSCSPSPYQQQTTQQRSSSILSLTTPSIPLRSNSQSSALSSSSQHSSTNLHAYGIPLPNPLDPTSPAWRCAYPNCTSRATFTRGCDLRKHYNRHSKHLFCRIEGCPQSQAAAAQSAGAGQGVGGDNGGFLTGGFSSKKDRARHEAKHNPGIKCEWKGQGAEEVCGRVFSRMDNMKDHVRRIHRKGGGEKGK